MSEYSRQLIYELLQFRRAEPSATEALSRLMHNADLCPAFQRQIDAIFSAFRKYQRIVYDIQGPRDMGTDIVLREPMDDETGYVCFQIKSDLDLKKNEYLKDLKAQHFDARNKYQAALQDYYILLCCSVVKPDKERKQWVSDEAKKGQIRAIEGEFAAETKVHVIEPEFVVTFLNLSAIQIDAIIKSKFGDEDIVFKEALNLVSGLSSTEKALVVFMLWLRLYRQQATINPEDILRSSFILDVYDRGVILDEDDDDYLYDQLGAGSQIVRDIEYLQDKFIERDNPGNYLLDLESVQPLAVLMMDGAIRYDYHDDELLNYMLELLAANVDPNSNQQVLTSKDV